MIFQSVRLKCISYYEGREKKVCLEMLMLRMEIINYIRRSAKDVISFLAGDSCSVIIKVPTLGNDYALL